MEEDTVEKTKLLFYTFINDHFKQHQKLTLTCLVLIHFNCFKNMNKIKHIIVSTRK